VATSGLAPQRLKVEKNDGPNKANFQIDRRELKFGRYHVHTLGNNILIFRDLDRDRDRENGH
jgi:hypothetical protein